MDGTIWEVSVPEGLVNIDPLFKNKFKFPWDFAGLTLPCAGSCHSYIANALAPLYPELQTILAGKPAMFELRRFAKLEGGEIFQEIADYCDRVESHRDSVATKVLNFLSTHRAFKAAFQVKIDAAYRQGIITIPDECKSRGESRWKHTSESL
jgi:hypothetical protein